MICIFFKKIQVCELCKIIENSQSLHIDNKTIDKDTGESYNTLTSKQNYVKLESELLILLKSNSFLSSSQFGKGFETTKTEYGKVTLKM